jgi:hypothetical protein
VPELADGALALLFAAEIFDDPVTAPTAPVGGRYVSPGEQALESDHERFPLLRIRLRLYDELHRRRLKAPAHLDDTNGG